MLLLYVTHAAAVQVWPNTAAQMAADLHANTIEDGGPTGIAGYEGVFVPEYAILTALRTVVT